MTNDRKRVVFFVSDSTGASAKVLGAGLLKQFEAYEFAYLLRPFIDAPEKATQLVEEINALYRKTGVRPIVMATIVDEEISALFSQASAVYFNFYNTFISMLENILGSRASRKTGQARGIANARRRQSQMNALEFVLKNDDGLHVEDYDVADVIIFGPSRCAKTPVCLHLAIEHGICAANYPMVEDDIGFVLPKLLRPHRERLFGLVSDPRKLAQVREMRSPGSDYAAYSQCVYEVSMIEKLCQTEDIEYANSSQFSIEEIAALVVRRLSNLTI